MFFKRTFYISLFYERVLDFHFVLGIFPLSNKNKFTLSFFTLIIELWFCIFMNILVFYLSQGGGGHINFIQISAELPRKKMPEERRQKVLNNKVKIQE